MPVLTAEQLRADTKVETVERLAREVGRLFDRDKIPADQASAVLIDLTALVLAQQPAAIRPTLLDAAKKLLEELMNDYAEGLHPRNKA